MDQSALAGWHDFYVTMGTASASLIGLLFVALSLNLDIVTAEAREDLRAYAEQAFNSFSTVLLMAVMFLIPEQGAGVLGVAYVALGLAGAYRMLRRAPVFWRGRKRGGLGEAVFWRFVLPAAATLTLIVSGVAILQNQPAALYWLVWVIIGLLISAARSSWDLLVKVGEEKRGTAGSKPDAVVSPRASAGAGHGAANVEPAASPGAQVPRSDRRPARKLDRRLLRGPMTSGYANERLRRASNGPIALVAVIPTDGVHSRAELTTGRSTQRPDLLRRSDDHLAVKPADCAQPAVRMTTWRSNRGRSHPGPRCLSLVQLRLARPRTALKRSTGRRVVLCPTGGRGCRVYARKLELPVVNVVSLVRARVRAMLDGRHGQEDEQQGEGDQFHIR